MDFTIRIPKCWKDLVQVEFPEDLNGIEDGDRRVVVTDDPKPYYDDARCISINLDGTRTFTLNLMSGQGNYFGGYIFDDIDDTLESEPLEAFTDVEETFGGTEYRIKIEWV